MWDEAQQDRWKDNMHKIATILVESTWPAIEGVAKAAIDRRTLSAEQVNHYMTDAWSGWDLDSSTYEPTQKG